MAFLLWNHFRNHIWDFWNSDTLEKRSNCIGSHCISSYWLLLSKITISSNVKTFLARNFKCFILKSWTFLEHFLSFPKWFAIDYGHNRDCSNEIENICKHKRFETWRQKYLSNSIKLQFVLSTTNMNNHNVNHKAISTFVFLDCWNTDTLLIRTNVSVSCVWNKTFEIS